MIKLELLPETTLQLQVAEKVIKTAPPVIAPKRITENGTYAAKEEGVYGFDPVTVADQLMQHHLSLVAMPGVPVFDWGQKDFAFHVPVTLADGSAAISENALRQLLTQWGLLDQ